jgi:hypothetical protein
MATFQVFLGTGALCLALPLVTGRALGADAAAPQQTRTVHLSVTTDEGAPVTDLSAADFEVKEGGRTRDVGRAALTNVPIRMAILVADEGTGAFQQVIVSLVEPLLDVAEFKLVSVVAQPDTIVDYTSDAETLTAGIRKMGTRAARPGSSQLMEAIAENLETLSQPGRRPVMVVMRMGRSASSPLRQDVVRETLRRTGTLLFAMSPANTTGSTRPAAVGYGGGAMGQALTDHAGAESVSRSRSLDSVLNDGSRQSGGRHVYVSSQTALPQTGRFVQELLNEYQLAWALPAGEKPSDRLEVSVKRRGLRVNAPDRIAN